MTITRNGKTTTISDRPCHKYEIETTNAFSSYCVVKEFEDESFFPDTQEWVEIAKEIWNRNDASKHFGVII